MDVWANPRATHAHVLDSLFANGPATGTQSPVSVPPLTPPSRQSPSLAGDGFGVDGVPVFQPTQPPPALQSPADLAAAYEWFQTEKRHLEEQTRKAIAAIHQHHQAAVARDVQREGALAL